MREYTKNGSIKVAYDFFTQEKGYTPAQAVGIVGHLLDESGFNTTIRGDGGKAFGIAQWHPDRQANLDRHAASLGLSRSDLKAQLSFVDWELRNTEKAAGDRVRAAQSPSEASRAFASYERYENWQDPNFKRSRSSDNHARNLFKMFTGETVPEFSTASLSSSPGTPQERQRMQSLRPETPATDFERTRQSIAQEEAAQKGPGFLDASGSALRLGQTLNYLWNSPPATAIDPEYNISKDQEWFKERTKAWKTDDLSALTGAHSREHAEYLASRVEAKMKDEQTLAGYGYKGVGLRLASEILDPVALAAGVGIGSIVKVGKAGMAVKAGIGALEGAAGNLAVDALRAPADPTYGATDALWSVGAGLVFGGTIGAFARHPDAPDVARLGQQMTNEADGRFSGSAGAAYVGPAIENIRPAVSQLLDNVYGDLDSIAPKSTLGKARFSLSARLGSSDNPLTRMWGDQLVADGAPKKGRVATVPAELRQKQIESEATLRWRYAFDEGFDDWAERNNIGILQRDSARRQFGNDIYEAAQNTNPLKEFDPAVSKVAAAHRQMMSDLHDLQANPGLIDGGTYRPVRGFGPDNKVENYVTRKFDEYKIDESVHTYRVEQLEDALKASIKSVAHTIDDDVASAVARAVLKRGRESSAGLNRGNYKAFSGEDLGLLRQILEHEGLSGKKLDSVVDFFKVPKTDAGNVDRAKKRVLLNEMYEVQLKNYSTGQIETKRISDLLYKTDANELMHDYIRESSSNIALAMVQVRNPRYVKGGDLPEFIVNGITNRSEFQTHLDDIRAAAAEMKVNKAQTDKDVERLQFAYDKITGVPVHNLSEGVVKGMRLIKQYNYLRAMGQVGLAQIPELMNTVSTFGVRALIDSIPEFKGAIRDAKTKQLNNLKLREMEAITGHGADWFKHLESQRWDDGVAIQKGTTTVGKAMDMADNAMQKAGRVQTALSLMAPVNTFLQRGTLAIMVNKFADMAAKVESGKSVIEASRKGLGKGDDLVNRLKSVGVDEDKLERIIDQMRKHSTWESGEITGKKFRTLDLDKWDDLQAAASMKMALFQWSRRVIQENDIGSMAMWMQRPTAGMMLQFRTFMLNAWDKQFMYNVNMRDFTAFQYMTLGIFAGSMTYVGQTYVNSMGRGDQDKFLDKKLQPKEIGAAGFQRWAGSAIIPMATDSILAPFNDGKPIFDGRNTQLPSEAIFGAPFIDLANNVVKTQRGFADMAKGKRSWDKQDSQAFRSILPFQNTLPAMLLYNNLTSDLTQGPRR